MPSRVERIQEEIVTRPQELAACCEHLAACRLFGFDTEFVGEESYRPHLCLVQVATAERLYLIDPLTVGPLDQFWEVAVDPANRVVVHAGREEIRLCHLWSGKTPGNVFDLQIAAGLAGLIYPLGYGTLVNQLLHVRMSKLETLTEWRDRPLTRQQLRYAFDDVRHLLHLHEHLHARLEKLERGSWAGEEFCRLTLQATADEQVTEKWRRLRGLGALERRRLAVVRDLYRWREATAARTNRPPRTLVRDDLLIEIARRDPRRPEDLHVIRGLPRRDLPAIVEVVERARALPDEELPEPAEREQDPSQVGVLVHLLTAVLGDFCARSQLAGNLVASNNDLKLLVRAFMQGAAPPSSSLLSQGWRSQHVLPLLQAVLEGRHGVRVGDVSAEAPLATGEVNHE